MARRGTDPTERDLDGTLADLADVVDAIASAVGSHDLAALEAANARAVTLQAHIAALVAALDDAERARPSRQLAGLVARLRLGVRRNALLIERAWSIDAATTRLLLSLGRTPTEPLSVAYVPPAVSTLERHA
jgi:hypothetical protein